MFLLETVRSHVVYCVVPCCKMDSGWQSMAWSRAAKQRCWHLHHTAQHPRNFVGGCKLDLNDLECVCKLSSISWKGTDTKFAGACPAKDLRVAERHGSWGWMHLYASVFTPNSIHIEANSFGTECQTAGTTTKHRWPLQVVHLSKELEKPPNQWQVSSLLWPKEEAKHKTKRWKKSYAFDTLCAQTMELCFSMPSSHLEGEEPARTNPFLEGINTRLWPQPLLLWIVH